MNKSMDRPPRKMPSAWSVVDRWMHGYPRCFRCGWEGDRPSDIERAHVIDRVKGGLDTLDNLRPLCHECHRLQPSFGPGDEEMALTWFRPGVPAVLEHAISCLARLLVAPYPEPRTPGQILSEAAERHLATIAWERRADWVAVDTWTMAVDLLRHLGFGPLLDDAA